MSGGDEPHAIGAPAAAAATRKIVQRFTAFSWVATGAYYLMKLARRNGIAFAGIKPVQKACA
jgi:hypothetical protein